MADHAKNGCSSNCVSKTLSSGSAMPCDTNSGTHCANENSDEDYLNEISLEYENIKRQGPPWMKNSQKSFKAWFGTTQNLKKMRTF